MSFWGMTMKRMECKSIVEGLAYGSAYGRALTFHLAVGFLQLDHKLG